MISYLLAIAISLLALQASAQDIDAKESESSDEEWIEVELKGDGSILTSGMIERLLNQLESEEASNLGFLAEDFAQRIQDCTRVSCFIDFRTAFNRAHETEKSASEFLSRQQGPPKYIVPIIELKEKKYLVLHFGNLQSNQYDSLIAMKYYERFSGEFPMGSLVDENGISFLAVDSLNLEAIKLITSDLCRHGKSARSFLLKKKADDATSQDKIDLSSIQEDIARCRAD